MGDVNPFRPLWGSVMRSVFLKSILATAALSPSPVALTADITGTGADLSRQCRAQMRSAVGAFMHRDAGRAHDVKLLDNPIDQKHHDIVDRVIELMKIERLEIGDYVHLLFCVKNVERIADHAVNIAEAAHLKSTGRPIGPVTSLNAG